MRGRYARHHRAKLERLARPWRLRRAAARRRLRVLLAIVTGLGALLILRAVFP